MGANSRNLWLSIERLVILFPYKDELHYREFRQLLDRALNESNVNKLEIIVSLPPQIKKEELPPHRLIHFISPKDFNLFGKLKNDVLGTVFWKEYDAFICFEDDSLKLGKALKELKAKHKVGINSDMGNFTIDLRCNGEKPEDLVNFAKNTLLKLSTDE